MHEAKVIINPEAHALDITHRHANIEHEQRSDFIEKHQIVAVGSDAIAFSTICCNDHATVERHTIHLPGEVTADEIRAVMEHHVQDHAQRHAKAVSAVEIVKQLAVEGVECKECK